MEQGTTKIADLPFFVTFTYKEQSFKITLIDGQDIFKLAKVFCNILEQNGIDYKIERTTI